MLELASGYLLRMPHEAGAKVRGQAPERDERQDARRERRHGFLMRALTRDSLDDVLCTFGHEIGNPGA
jgi:hypothetical protein